MAIDKYVKWDEEGVEYGMGKEEDELIAEIGRQINTAQQAEWEAHRHCFSGTHVKTHGVVKGTLEVLPNLPPHLAQGLFAEGSKVFPCALRHSTETTAMIDDRVRQPRGIGVKVFDIEGEKLRPDGKDPRTQDFEFNSSPVLELGNARTCRDIIALRLQHGGCPAALDGALKQREDYDVQDARNHIPAVDLLAQRQYSQSALRYGEYVAKFALVPQHPASVDGDREISASDGPHAFKEMMRRHYATHDSEWDLQVQLLERDFFREERAAVEDARIDWPQKTYPYVTVAKLRVPKQESFSHKRVTFWEDRLRLDPWHGLKVHKPLGSINRVRKGVYKASSTYRRRLNATTEVTVASIDDIPD